MGAPYFRLMPPDFKGGGVVRFMAAAEGCVMVRRPGLAAFVVSTRDWNRWPLCDRNGDLLKEPS